MNGLLDSPNYLVADNGMRIWAAVKGNKLYFATWSSQGGTSDHFLLLANNFGNPAAHPWTKAGQANFWFGGWPWLAGEGDAGASPISPSTTAALPGARAMGSGGNVLEGEIDLVERFGSVPKVIYLTALAYGDNDGAGILSQCPAPWGSADNDLTIPNTPPSAWTRSATRIPTATTTAGTRRWNPKSMAPWPMPTTACAAFSSMNPPATPPASRSASRRMEIPRKPVTDVEVITNLNRRDHAVIQEDLDTVTTSSNTYHRAYPMT